jgi:hypothetical protein
MPIKSVIVDIGEDVVLYLKRKPGQGRPLEVGVKVLSDGTPEIWVTKDDAKEGIIHTWQGRPVFTSTCI